jgi:hypothetical protein
MQWTWASNRFPLRDCCCQLNNISPAQVENAHKAPAPPTRFQNFVRQCRYGDQQLDVVPVLKEKPNLKINLCLQESEHLERANRALAILKRQNDHFNWRSIFRQWRIQSTTVLDNNVPERQEDAAIDFSNAKYVVPVRSNLRIDGFRYLKSLADIENDRMRFIGKQAYTFIAISAIYGGLHLTAWNTFFPTVIEKWFWRSASLTMAGTPAVIWACMMTWRLGESIQRGRLSNVISFKKLKSGLWELVTLLSVVLMMLLICILVVAYPVARVYVLVEGFAGLRIVPQGMYQTIEWTGFIPHAG